MLKPLNNRIVVEYEEPQEEVTESGFIVKSVDKVKEDEKRVPLLEGKVVGDYTIQGTDVPDGTRILFSRYGMDEGEIDGKKVYFVSEKCILATL